MHFTPNGGAAPMRRNDSDATLPSAADEAIAATPFSFSGFEPSLSSSSDAKADTSAEEAHGLHVDRTLLERERPQADARSSRGARARLSRSGARSARGG